MTNLYITYDTIGERSGGGLVTAQESAALRELGPAICWERRLFKNQNPSDVWAADAELTQNLQKDPFWYQLAHGYSGTWPTTIKLLKDKGIKTTWMIAAHDVAISRREHEGLGIGFPYKHLTEPELWKKYISGYHEVDVLITPGKAPLETLRRQGFTQRIEIIPHGCTIPATTKPLPEKFVLGYAGSFGADKGIRYLMAAWKKLDYKDGSMLLLGGRDSIVSGQQYFTAFGGGVMAGTGWLDDIGNFYNQISLYVQPSATEGFGLEVSEAMAYGRAALCSLNAGAADIATDTFEACNVDVLAETIDAHKKMDLVKLGADAREKAKTFTWDVVKEQYKAVWRGVM